MKKTLFLLLITALITSCSTSPNRVIKYMTNDGCGISVDINKFGDAKIVSHKYSEKEQCFVIKFNKDLKTIGNTAFYRCYSIVDFVIPPSVTNIGVGAFAQCVNLYSIEIPENVTTIGEKAFADCKSLSFVKLDKAYIGNNAFANCNAIETIEINCAKFGNHFQKKPNLRFVTLGDNVTSIDYAAFMGCVSLTEVAIGNGVEYIGDCAFQYCESLESISIPDNVTSIGKEAGPAELRD